jgi:hypothetical protein
MRGSALLRLRPRAPQQAGAGAGGAPRGLDVMRAPRARARPPRPVACTRASVRVRGGAGAQDEGDKMLVLERGDLVFVFNFHPVSSFSEYRVGAYLPGPYKARARPALGLRAPLKP